MCGFPSEFTEPDGWWALDIDDPRFVGPFVYQFQPEGLMSFFGENGDTPNAACQYSTVTLCIGIVIPFNLLFRKTKSTSGFHNKHSH